MKGEHIRKTRKMEQFALEFPSSLNSFIDFSNEGESFKRSQHSTLNEGEEVELWNNNDKNKKLLKMGYKGELI